MQENRKFALVVLMILASCGEDESGRCVSDTACPNGFVCRAGVCIQDVIPSAGNDNENGNANNSNDNDTGPDNSNDNDANNNENNNNDNSSDNANSNDSNSNDNGSNGNDNTNDVGPSDITPPSIRINSPAAFSLTPTVTLIDATVSDDVSLDPTSVRAVIGREGTSEDARITVELVQTGADRFVGELDIRDLATQVIFASIAVRASDAEGNTAEAGHSFALDQSPPEVGFDAGVVQGLRDDDSCSQPVTVTGVDNIRHGDIARPNIPSEEGFASSTFPIRVRIEDTGNSDLLGDATAVAKLWGIDPDASSFFILDQAALATGANLFVQGSDGQCDINPGIRPTGIDRRAEEAIVLGMVEVPVSGGFWYTDPAEPTADGSPDPVSLDGLPCSTVPEGESTEPPEDLCRVTADGVTAWVGSTRTSNPDVAAIFAAAPYSTSADSLECGGGLFDIRNVLQDGPACITARAVDAGGNVSVARPIAICIDTDLVGGECVGFDPDSTRTRCTLGCAPPQAQFGWIIRDR